MPSVRSLALSPKGDTIVSASGDIDEDVCTRSHTIKVWDAASLELKAEKKSAHSAWVRSVAFSPDGKTIVSSSEDATLKLWDAASLELPFA